MKKLLTLVLCWLIAFSAMAETTLKAKTALSAAGGYITSQNKVDGSFEDGISSWSASVGTIVKTASTEIQGNNIGVWSGTGAGTLDFQWTATASNTFDGNEFVNVGGEDDVYVCAYVGTTETGCKLIPALDKIQKVSVIADSIISSAFYLRLKHTGSDAFSVKVDDGKIEPQSFQNFPKVEQESVSYTGYSSGTSPVVFKTKDTERSNEKNILAITTVGSAGTASRYTILKPCAVNVVATGDFSSSGAYYLKIGHFNSSDAEIKYADNYIGNGAASDLTAAMTTKANAGDYFIVQTNNAILNNVTANFSITATAISDNVVQSWQDGMATWSATSTIQIGATTTAPTKGTTNLDQVRWIKRGESAEFWYQYNQTGNGSGGSGEYLYSLPSGLSFDSSVKLYTGLEGSGPWMAQYSIGSGSFHNGSNGFNGTAYVVPYDSTRFRLFVLGGIDTNPISNGPHSSSYGSYSGLLDFSIKFTAPIAGWSSGPTLYSLPTRSEVFSANISASGVATNATQNFVTSCTNAAPSVCSLWSNFGVAPICWTHTVDITKRAEVTASTATTTTVARTDTSTAFNLFCHLK